MYDTMYVIHTYNSQHQILDAQLNPGGMNLWASCGTGNDSGQAAVWLECINT